MTVLLTGWSTGFHIYLICLIPLVFFYDGWNREARLILSSLVLVFADTTDRGGFAASEKVRKRVAEANFVCKKAP